MKQKIRIILLMLLLGNISYGKTTSLEEVLSIALENNLQIKLSETEMKTSETKKGQTKSLYLPKIKLSGGYVHLNEMPDTVKIARKLGEMNNGIDDLLTLLTAEEATVKASGGTAGAIAGGYLSTYQSASAGVSKVDLEDDGLNYQSIKLSFEQALYTGGKISAVNSQAELGIEIANLNNKKSMNDITFEVKKAYYNVVQAKRALKTANEIYASIEKHVTEASNYFDAGMVPYLDVVRAKAKLSEIKQKVIMAENAVNISKAYLDFVIGKNLPEDFEPDGNVEFTEITDKLDTFQNTALSNRVEIKIYEKKIMLAQKNKDVIESQKKPIIALTGEYKYEATDITKADPKWQVGIVGSWSVYDGGMISSQIDDTESVIEQAKIGKDLVTNSIKIEVRQAYLNTINALETIKVSEKSLEQAKEVVRMSEVNYSNGLSSSMERIDAEVFLEQSKNSYDAAVSQFIVAKANLEKAIGQF